MTSLRRLLVGGVVNNQSAWLTVAVLGVVLLVVDVGRSVVLVVTGRDDPAAVVLQTTVLAVIGGVAGVAGLLNSGGGPRPPGAPPA